MVQKQYLREIPVLVIFYTNHQISLEAQPKKLLGIIQSFFQQRIRYWSCFMGLSINFCLEDTIVCSFEVSGFFWNFMTWFFIFKANFFCLEYILVSALMQLIREDVEKEHPAIQPSDVTVFFGVVEFVTSFQFHKHSASKVRKLIWDIVIKHQQECFSLSDSYIPSALINDVFIGIARMKWFHNKNEAWDILLSLFHYVYYLETYTSKDQLLCVAHDLMGPMFKWESYLYSTLTCHPSLTFNWFSYVETEFQLL